MSNKYPAIPEPTAEVRSLQNSVLALKEAVELLTGQRGTNEASAVTYKQMVEWGKIGPEQVPPR